MTIDRYSAAWYEQRIATMQAAECPDIDEEIRQAVATDDAARAARVVEVLRQSGLTYREILTHAQGATTPPVDVATWDRLLYEGDDAQAL